MKLCKLIIVVMTVAITVLTAACATATGKMDPAVRARFEVATTNQACYPRPASQTEALPLIVLADIGAQVAGSAINQAGSWLKEWADKYNATYSAQYIWNFYTVKTSLDKNGKSFPDKVNLNIACIQGKYIASNGPSAKPDVSILLALVEKGASGGVQYMYLTPAEIRVNKFVSRGDGPKDLVIKVHMDYIVSDGKTTAIKGMDFVLPSIDAVSTGAVLKPQDLENMNSNIQPLPAMPSLGEWKCSKVERIGKVAKVVTYDSTAPQDDAHCSFVWGSAFKISNLYQFIPTAITVTVVETDKGWGSKIASAMADALTGSKDSVVKSIQDAANSKSN
jgi:hypothetical protein